MGGPWVGGGFAFLIIFCVFLLQCLPFQPHHPASQLWPNLTSPPAYSHSREPQLFLSSAVASQPFPLLQLLSRSCPLQLLQHATSPAPSFPSYHSPAQAPHLQHDLRLPTSAPFLAKYPWTFSCLFGLAFCVSKSKSSHPEHTHSLQETQQWSYITKVFMYIHMSYQIVYTTHYILYYQSIVHLNRI